jgi:hypothetical protein
MLSPKISTDARVRQLPCAEARLLFTWALAHADNLGRMRSEAAYVRATVLPHEPGVTDEKVNFWLSEMKRLGLIRVYERDGGCFLQFRGWEKHQDLKRIGKRSDLPPPPADPPPPSLTKSCQTPPANCSPQAGLGPEVEVEVEVEVEGEVELEGETEAEAEGEGEGERGGETRADPPKMTSTARHGPLCVCEECFKSFLRRGHA